MRQSLIFLVFILLLSFATPSQAQDCTGPDGDIGALLYNEDYGVLQVCTTKNWIGLHGLACPNGDGCPCAGSPTPGTLCSDGSYYIGDSDADGAKVYMTSAAHETSSRWDEVPLCGKCGSSDTGATSITDGRANVTALRAYSGDSATAGNLDGFDAAKYCDNLTGVHGHDDWYLPAGGLNGTFSEINLIWLMVQTEGAVGGLTVSAGGKYWSSSEHSSNNGRVQQFSDGTQLLSDKTDTNLVRCVRR